MGNQTNQDLGAWPIQASTQLSYDSKVRTLQRYSGRLRYPEQPPSEHQPDPSISDMVQDLCERDDISVESKSSYRNSLLRLIQTSSSMDDCDKETAIAHLEEIKLSKAKIRASDNEKLISKNNKKSRSKKRSIRSQHEEKLLEYLHEHSESSLWARRVLLLIRATDVTGLRQVEWLHAEWNEDQQVLHVRTAKQPVAEPAYKRSKGALRQGKPATRERVKRHERDIDVEECDKQAVLDYLFEFQRAVPRGLSEDERRQAFRKYYDQCKCAFARACRAVFGERRYWLKTFRSQFSANMKCLLGPDATATLMGHSSADSPSSAWYGKANQAHPHFKSLRQQQVERQRQLDSASRYERER